VHVCRTGTWQDFINPLIKKQKVTPQVVEFHACLPGQDFINPLIKKQKVTPQVVEFKRN